LHDTAAIAQVQKDHAAMIPSPINPATEGYSFINMSRSELTTIVSSHSRLSQMLGGYFQVSSHSSLTFSLTNRKQYNEDLPRNIAPSQKPEFLLWVHGLFPRMSHSLTHEPPFWQLFG
jgi:hypothetical protein